MSQNGVTLISYRSTQPSGMTTMKDTSSLMASWSNLTCEVKSTEGRRTILANFSGQVAAREMVGVLGPSGSGKSTFLDCFSGKRKPDMGSVEFFTRDRKCLLAYVPQTDDLFVHLTVRESLMFASQFKNKLKSKEDHKSKVDNIIGQFGLQSCANSLVRKCSGGEVKRLSVAQELISDPNVLVLDEPTTGLDSYAALNCANLLKSATVGTDRNLAVLMTIHQPNTELFALFDRVYILSVGRCIYAGQPNEIPKYLAQVNLRCPKHYNPADYLLDIAHSGIEDGSVALLNSNYMESLKSMPGVHPNLEKVALNTSQEFNGFLIAFWVHVQRFALSNLRDPQQSVVRLLEFLFFPIMIYICSTRETFETSPCVYTSHNETHIEEELSYARFDRRKVILQSIYYLCFNGMFLMLCSALPGALTFSSHTKALIKEYRNNWYSHRSFFFGFILVSALYTFAYNFANALAYYVLARNMFTFDSFAIFVVCNLLVCLFGDSYGVLVATITPRNLTVAIMLVITINYSACVMSNLVFNQIHLGPFTKHILDLSTLHYCLQVLFTTLYPIEKCIVDQEKIFSMKQMQDFIKFFNYEANSTLDDLDDVPVKMWNSLLENDWTRRKMVDFAEAVNNLEGDNLSTLEHFLDIKPNLVVNEYSLKDVNVENSLLFGCVLIAAHYFACYVLTHYRARGK